MSEAPSHDLGMCAEIGLEHLLKPEDDEAIGVWPATCWVPRTEEGGPATSCCEH